MNWVPPALVLQKFSPISTGEKEYKNRNNLRCAQIRGKDNRIALLIIDQGKILMLNPILIPLTLNIMTQVSSIILN